MIQVEALKRKAGCSKGCRVTVHEAPEDGLTVVTHGPEPDGMDQGEFFDPSEDRGERGWLDDVIEWLRGQHG